MLDQDRIKINNLIHRTSFDLIDDIDKHESGQVKCHICKHYEFPDLMRIEKVYRKGRNVTIKTCWECINKK